MNPPSTEELQKRLGKLVDESLQISTPVQVLYRINLREYQHFHKREILLELNRLQSIMIKMHDKIRLINNLLEII